MARKNSILHFFETTSQTLAEKRDAVLNLIDNIPAIRPGLEEFDVRSIAISARAHKIDEEWSRHITANSSIASWWTPGRPRIPQSMHSNPNHISQPLIGESSSRGTGTPEAGNSFVP